MVDACDNQMAQRDETARIELTTKMIPIMVETVGKFTAMGASPEHIVRFLQATIDEINSDRMG